MWRYTEILLLILGGNMIQNFKMSKGEEKILQILLKNNIQVIREKTFTDLKRGKYRFDFYLPQFNICIEYDGPQHFQYIKYFYKKQKDFLAARERDRRKNSYCLSHNINLYRIPYFSIDTIKNFSDLFNEEFIVKSKWHNDMIIQRRIYGNTKSNL